MMHVAVQTRLIAGILGMVLAFATNQQAEAQCEIAALGPPEPTPLCHLVAIDGDVAVVGDPGFGVGVVRVYRRLEDEWTLEDELYSSEPGAEDYFGAAVAVENDIIAVGAPLSDKSKSKAGGLDIFRYNGAGWGFEARLIGSGVDQTEGFGDSVDISDGKVLAGVPRDEAGKERLPGAGTAYVFRHTPQGWQEEAKLSASQPVEEGRFGTSVSLSADVALIGATGMEKAFVFRFADGAWSLEGILRPISSTGGYASSVAISADRAVVGAHLDDQAGADAGAVFVYAHRDRAWSDEAKLVASDGSPFDWFGRVLAISRNSASILVGAPIDDQLGFWSGSAYHFRVVEQGFIEKKLLPHDGQPGMLFGFDLCLSDDWGIIGAVGAGYVYAGMQSGDCNENGNPDSCDILLGESKDIDGDGVPDECVIADVNGDGDVDWIDLLLLLSNWGACPTPCPPWCQGDVNHDCIVNLVDLLHILRTF